MISNLIRPRVSLDSRNCRLFIRSLSPSIFSFRSGYQSLTSQRKLGSLTTSIWKSSLHTTSRALDFYRPPKNYIIGGGPLSKIWSRIPDGVKLITGIGLSAYLLIFVAIPILTLVIPPLLIGSWIVFRSNKFLREKQNQRRWDLIKDSTLIFEPQHKRDPRLLPPPEQINSEIANFEINRIIDAFWSNEQGISDKFQVDINDLALGSIDAVQFNYNSNASVFIDDYQMMAIIQRTLYDKSKGKEIANVIMSLKMLERPMFEDIVDPIVNIGKSLVLIEISPRSLFDKSYYLKTSSLSSDFNNESEIIDVKGKTRTL